MYCACLAVGLLSLTEFNCHYIVFFVWHLCQSELPSKAKINVFVRLLQKIFSIFGKHFVSFNMAVVYKRNVEDIPLNSLPVSVFVYVFQCWMYMYTCHVYMYMYIQYAHIYGLIYKFLSHQTYLWSPVARSVVFTGYFTRIWSCKDFCALVLKVN